MAKFALLFYVMEVNRIMRLQHLEGYDLALISRAGWESIRDAKASVRLYGADDWTTTAEEVYVG
jgi:hypothetical protein